jgi:hypothetical protein
MNRRSWARRCALLPAALLLAACMSTPPIPASPRASPAAGATAVVGTEIAGPDTILQPLPTGVLLLTEPADGEGFERNLAACRAFVMRLPSAATLRAAAPVASNIIATRWLTTGSSVTLDRLRRAGQPVRLCARRRPHPPHPPRGKARTLLRRLPRRLLRRAVDGSSNPTGELGDFVGQWAEVIVRSSNDYARLTASHDDMAMLAPPRQPLTVAEVPGPALVLIGILKTAVQAIFAVASIFTG